MNKEFPQSRDPQLEAFEAWQREQRKGRIEIEVVPVQPGMAALLFYSRPTNDQIWLVA